MPHMVSFPLSHPLREAAEAALGLGGFVTVAREGLGPRNFCHGNVDAAIAERGGRGVIGWQIEWWPGLFVRALPHAVVELPGGALLDVTRGDRGDLAGPATFVPAERRDGPLAGTVQHLAPSRYFVIADEPEVHEMIAAAEEQRALKRRLDDVMHARGFVERGGELVAPDRATDRAFDAEFGEEMRASIARVDRAVQACERLAAKLNGA